MQNLKKILFILFVLLFIVVVGELIYYFSVKPGVSVSNFLTQVEPITSLSRNLPSAKTNTSSSWKNDKLGVSSVNLYKDIKREGVKVYGITNDGTKVLLYLNGPLAVYDVTKKYLVMSDGSENQLIDFSEIDEINLIIGQKNGGPIQERAGFDDQRIKSRMVASFTPRFSNGKGVLQIDIRYQR